MKKTAVFLMLATVAIAYVIIYIKTKPVPTISAPTPVVEELPTISQGLYGTVTIAEGTCMPGLPQDDYGCTFKPVTRKIFIYPPLNQDDFDVTYKKTDQAPLKEVSSDQNGFYELELPAGNYSVLVENDGKQYCNSFTDQGEACLSVIGASPIKNDIRIDNAVW